MSVQIKYAYDLFVSYADVDRAWVEGYLLDALTEAGVRVPAGFATTADAYRDFLSQDGLDQLVPGLRHRVAVAEGVLGEESEVVDEVERIAKTGPQSPTSSSVEEERR